MSVWRTPGGGTLELRVFDGFKIPPREGSLSAGVVVSARTAVGVPAVKAAVRLASTAVASVGRRGLPVWRGEGTDRMRVTATWQARFLAGIPNPVQSRFVFWETVEQSISYRGNAYVWKTRDGAGRVIAWWALHPDQVVPVTDGAELRFDVTVAPGFVDPTGRGPGVYRGLDASTILHIPGHGGGGARVAPSPIEQHRSTIGAAIAKSRHEEGLYARGAASGLVVSFPERVTAAQADEWRKVFESEYAGVENAHRTKVIGGGATIQPITLSAQDAQYVESVRLSVDEAARIIGVPASLIGGGQVDRPVTPEHEQDRWHRFGLGPRLERIEDAIAADPDIFGAGARDYPEFSVPDVRGDVATESRRLVSEVQAGILLPDEARAVKGLDPLPDGVGLVPQIVPVGGAPNPDPTPPPPPADE